MIVLCDGNVIGAADSASSNSVPSRARRSIVSVRAGTKP
jgi:hypothetical protein